MLTLWYLLLVHMAVYQSLTQGDASESFRLCVNDSVLVKPNSSGTIEYKHSDGENVGSCSLMLRGFETGSHISLPGVDAAGCLPNQTNVTINNESYCVKEGLSENTLIIRITHTLSIKLPSPGPAGFSFEFYNNVVTCGQKVAVSDALETNQLSGIFARSYDPNTLSMGACQIKFKKNCSEPFFMLFKILHAVDAQTEVVGKLVYPVLPNIRKGQRHTESSSNGEIGLIYRGHAGLSEYSVLVKYSVLYCNTKSLELANATITPGHEMMLAGAMRTFAYSCMEGLMLNGTRELNVECMVDEQGQTTLHRQDNLARECVPVTCNHLHHIISIDNGNISSTQDKYSYKDELKYECDDGYNKKGSVVCGDEGIWTGTPGCAQSTTDEDECPRPPTIRNADLVTLNSTALYYCKKGCTETSGDRYMHCTTNGGNVEWTGRMLVCKRAVLLSVVVGVTVPIGLALLSLSVILTALYCKRYITSRDKHQQGMEEKEMTDLTEAIDKSRPTQAQGSDTQPTFSGDLAYTNLPAPTSTSDYEVLSRNDDREYEKLQ